MAIQVPSDFLTELLKLEREKSKVMSLAQAWGLELQDQEEQISDQMKKSIKEAAGL
jgi:hypothetical protein|tara:strand:+ start:9010 stop:9177 length:168 start_codon:yes stop_codon:yes gene_type:complete